MNLEKGKETIEEIEGITQIEKVSQSLVLKRYVYDNYTNMLICI